MSRETEIQEHLDHEYRLTHVTIIIVSGVTGIHYNMYLYDTTVFSIQECPCNGDTNTCNNSDHVTVIQYIK